ncbi:MAG: DinB family protein [Gemmatimonadetes bacterium]|nr:DinB family protein [Gemmatimonadota bacterium]
MWPSKSHRARSTATILTRDRRGTHRARSGRSHRDDAEPPPRKPRCSFDELRAAWEESHRGLRRHVIAEGEGRISGAVFVHPVSGPLTTRQAIRMLRVHLTRHERQIRRILRAVEQEYRPEAT